MEIVLVRHGKPIGATNPKLTAVGFAHWVRNYNRSGIVEESSPPQSLAKQFEDHYVITSDLRRAIHSAEKCLCKPPHLSQRLLRELDIPRHKFPFVLTANYWLVINRLFWLLRIKSKSESYNEAKYRVAVAAKSLAQLAGQHDKLVVFSHALLNRFLVKELQRQGWHCCEKDHAYWGVTKLVMD